MIDWLSTTTEEESYPLLRQWEDTRIRPRAEHAEAPAFVDDLLAAARTAVPDEFRQSFHTSMRDYAYSSQFWLEFFESVGPGAKAVAKQYVDDLVKLARIVISFYDSVYDDALWEKGWAVWTRERGADARAMAEVRAHLETYQYYTSLLGLVRELPDIVAGVAAIVDKPRELLGGLVIAETTEWLQQFFIANRGKPKAQGRHLGELTGRAIAEYAFFALDLVSPV